MDAIKVDGITKTYGSRKVLDNISFGVKPGTIHGFLGPNGAGKTTTMRLIANLLRADKGAVWINGIQNSADVTTKDLNIGFLLEEPPLYKDMLVKDYFAFVASIKGVTKKSFPEHLEYVVDVLKLDGVLNRKVGNLSKGYRQRLGIAQAIISKPSIIILDEPTSGLDPQSVFEMRTLIKELKKNHTILISSHLLHEMSLICDYVSIISNGKIMESGSIEDLVKKMPKPSRIVLETLKSSEDFISEIKKIEGISYIEKDKENSLTYYIEVDQGIEVRDQILATAIKMELRPIEFRKEAYGLEDIFMRITKSC